MEKKPKPAAAALPFATMSSPRLLPDFAMKAQPARPHLAQNGAAAAPVEVAPPRKAGAIALRRRASVRQGLRRILSTCLQQADDNARGFLDSDDPAYLHQLRVGLRRFKSALKLFRDVVTVPPRLQARLDIVAAALGDARDADVLLLSTLPRIADAGRHRALLQGLFAHVQADAHAKRAAARRLVDSSAYTQTMLGLFAWIDGTGWCAPVSRQVRARLRRPLAAYARTAVVAAHGVVARRARKVQRGDARDSEALHRLRIGCKQARYTVEFFQAIARKKKAARYIDKLSAVQDALGTLNDCYVAQTLLAGYGRTRPALATEVRVAAAYLSGIASACLDRRQAPWHNLCKPKAALQARSLIRKGH